MLACIDSTMCARGCRKRDTHCLLHICGTLHSPMLGCFALFQCSALKLKCNLPLQPLRMHTGVLKSGNAAAIMTLDIAHQRTIADAYDACVQRRTTSVTCIGQLSTIVTFALMMDYHDASAERCHNRTLQAIPKRPVARSWPVQLALFFLRVDANITGMPVSTPTKWNKQKAPEQASSSPQAADTGNVAKKLMLTPKNKLSDSIGAASRETYTYRVNGVRGDVDVTQAFATAAIVAAMKAEVLIKLKTELKDHWTNCKPMYCYRITRQFYYKSSGEHEIDDDV